MCPCCSLVVIWRHFDDFNNKDTYNTSGKSEFIWFSSYRDIAQKQNSLTKSLKILISATWFTHFEPGPPVDDRGVDLSCFKIFSPARALAFVYTHLLTNCMCAQTTSLFLWTTRSLINIFDGSILHLLSPVLTSDVCLKSSLEFIVKRV